MNLVSRFTVIAKRYPDTVAIVESVGKSERIIRYSELVEQSNRAAQFFRKNGIGKGDTVLVFERMSINLYLVLIGLWRIGAVAMFVDPQGGRRLLDASCRIGKPKAFVALSKAHLYRFVSSEIRKIPVKVTIGARFLPSLSWQKFLRSEASEWVEPMESDAPALYTFTSGSTGSPKAANRTHGLLLAQHDALCEAIELVPGEVDLATLPIFTLANLASGLTTLIPDCDLSRPGFIDSEAVLRQIERHRPSRCVASPAFFMRLVEGVRREGLVLPFKKVYTGGAPVFPKYLHALRSVTSGAKINVVFGSTEAEPISHCELGEMSEVDFSKIAEGKGLLVGCPSLVVELRIIADSSGDSLWEISEERLEAMFLQSGEVGEIIVAGPHVLSGYLNGVGDSENKIRQDGKVWHRTGDAGYLDGQGRLWLMGRCSSRIIKAGRTAYPFSVEAALSLDKRIRWSALAQGEREVVLALELTEDGAAAPPSLEEFPELTGLVDRLVTLKQMPLDKRHNAKIDYPGLRKLLQI